MEKEEELSGELIIPCKIILVGDSGVGKTSIINRYLNKFTEKIKPTIGASYANKLEKIDNYNINFDIWDTAGQERFRAVNKIFYKEAHICIMVYDITNKESFDSIKNFWYNTVRENSSEKIIFGVGGNKADKYEEEQVNEKEAKEYSNSIDAEFHLTSAFQNTYIDQLFKGLGKKFIQSDVFKELLSQTSASIKKVNLENQNDNQKKKKKWC